MQWLKGLGPPGAFSERERESYRHLRCSLPVTLTLIEGPLLTFISVTYIYFLKRQVRLSVL